MMEEATNVTSAARDVHPPPSFKQRTVPTVPLSELQCDEGDPLHQPLCINYLCIYSVFSPG
jgi:hypothetical protein